MFDEEMHIPDQMKVLCAVLKPLADCGKILGCLPGNHEMRVEYLTGLNPMALLAERLNIPYMGYQGYIQVKDGNQKYDIMCHHGVGSGGSAAARIRSAERLSAVTDADIYLSGHTHGADYHKNEIWTFSNDGDLIPKIRHFVVAGSFLDYFNGYAEMKLLQPVGVGSVFIKLMESRKEVRVTI
jgi:hypothetical protein